MAGQGWLFWGGIAACVLGPVLAVVQLSLSRVGTPWYTPLLVTVGAVLLLISSLRRPSVVPITLASVAAVFAALLWFIFVSMLKLPDYAGPAQPGNRVPPFSTHYADGRPFTDATLRDGSRRVLVFFRGRW